MNNFTPTKTIISIHLMSDGERYDFKELHNIKTERDGSISITALLRVEEKDWEDSVDMYELASASITKKVIVVENSKAFGDYIKFYTIEEVGACGESWGAMVEMKLKGCDYDQ